MNNLQGLAYQVYVNNLTTTQRKALRDKIDASILADYEAWKRLIMQYIKDCDLGVHATNFNAYIRCDDTHGTHYGTLHFDDGFYAFRFALIKGRLRVIDYPDMGSVTYYVIERAEINAWCNQRKLGFLAKVLHFFMETHPDIK